MKNDVNWYAYQNAIDRIDKLEALNRVNNDKIMRLEIENKQLLEMNQAKNELIECLNERIAIMAADMKAEEDDGR